MKVPEVQRCVICGEEWADMPTMPVHRCPDPPPPPPPGTPYTNPGKGTVLINESAANRLAHLFDERATWTSAELNARMGWQFSQAVHALRKRGVPITTLKLGPRRYAYRRDAA